MFKPSSWIMFFDMLPLGTNFNKTGRWDPLCVYMLVKTVGLVGAELEGIDLLPGPWVTLGHVLVLLVIARLDVLVPLVQTLLHAIHFLQVVLVHLPHVVDAHCVPVVRKVRQRRFTPLPAWAVFKRVVPSLVARLVEIKLFSVHAVRHEHVKDLPGCDPECIFEFSVVYVVLPLLNVCVWDP